MVCLPFIFESVQEGATTQPIVGSQTLDELRRDCGCLTSNSARYREEAVDGGCGGYAEEAILVSVFGGRLPFLATQDPTDCDETAPQLREDVELDDGAAHLETGTGESTTVAAEQFASSRRERGHVRWVRKRRRHDPMQPLRGCQTDDFAPLASTDRRARPRAKFPQRRDVFTRSVEATNTDRAHPTWTARTRRSVGTSAPSLRVTRFRLRRKPWLPGTRRVRLRTSRMRRRQGTRAQRDRVTIDGQPRARLACETRERPGVARSLSSRVTRTPIHDHARRMRLCAHAGSRPAHPVRYARGASGIFSCGLSVGGDRRT